MMVDPELYGFFLIEPSEYRWRYEDIKTEPSARDPYRQRDRIDRQDVSLDISEHSLHYRKNP